MVNLTKRLKELRAGKELTQTEIAKIIGLEYYIIGNWETGRSKPTLEDLCKLADFYQVSTDYILGREDDFGNKILSTTYEQLTKDQKELIDTYNSLSPLEKEAINLQLKVLTLKK